MSAIYTPPTSKAFSSATFGGPVSYGQKKKEVVMLGHDSGGHLASNAKYLELCRMSDGIADDMHKEALEGVSSPFAYGCGLK